MQLLNYLLKKGLNTLNEIKNTEIIKCKKRTPKQKELLNLFNDLPDIISSDKTLKSKSQEDNRLISSKDENENENGNENENNKILMSSKDDDDNENENGNGKTIMSPNDDDDDDDDDDNDDETMDQSKKTK